VAESATPLRVIDAHARHGVSLPDVARTSRLSLDWAHIQRQVSELRFPEPLISSDRGQGRGPNPPVLALTAYDPKPALEARRRRLYLHGCL